MHHASLKRRPTANVAQFVIEDAHSNVFCFEQRLTRAALTSMGYLRRLCRNHVRNAVRSATVQLPGREPIELF